jgi:hypothetical protein
LIASAEKCGESLFSSSRERRITSLERCRALIGGLAMAKENSNARFIFIAEQVFIKARFLV